jgi:integrase
MSDNTINSALRRMGYERDLVSGHGFRTTASTFLTEMGYIPEAIELQLAHVPKDKTRDAYNRAAQMQLRRSMMQRYADYLDELRKLKPR